MNTTITVAVKRETITKPNFHLRLNTLSVFKIYYAAPPVVVVNKLPNNNNAKTLNFLHLTPSRTLLLKSDGESPAVSRLKTF